MSGKNSSSGSSGGIGFVGALTIVFIVLKLTGFIDWSWWWVLSPIWISTLLTLLIFGIVVLIAYFANQSKKSKIEAFRRRLGR